MTNSPSNPKAVVSIIPELQASVLLPEGEEVPKSIMLIVSTDSEIVNRCTEFFFNHAVGRCSYQSPAHVGEVYDPKKHVHCVLMKTEEPYSDDFLFSTLLMMEDEIGDPGAIDRDFSKSKPSEIKTNQL